MRGVGNAVINQKLLADNPPKAASLGQKRLEAPCELSRARFGINGIRVIKADVNFHFGMLMISLSHFSHADFVDDVDRRGLELGCYLFAFTKA